MLKVGGENVAASEIEQRDRGGAWRTRGRGDRQERIRCWMKCRSCSSFRRPASCEAAPKDLHDTVMAACRNALADFKVPREIRFVDEMPRSTLEKVAKAELRKMLA